jgi:ABC-type transport system involved in multi-copper enzyme maturation permease subunit
MTFLPIVERELRVRTRRPTTYWTRVAVAAVAAMAGLQEIVLSAGSIGPNSLGQITFVAVSWVAFMVVCGSACVTADTISRERREGTLGLLLLTRLKAYDVVLGKLCAAGTTTYYALLGFVPALAIMVLAGGVSGGQLGRVALALVNGVFLSLAVGMWVSGLVQSRSNAMRWTLLTMVLFCVLPRIAMNVGVLFLPRASILAAFGPYSTFFLAFDKEYAGASSLYWISLVVVHLEAWLLLGWTAFRLARDLRSTELVPQPTRPVLEPLLKEEVEAMAASRAKLLEEDPVCWAVSRMRIQNALLWLGTVLLLLSGTGMSWGLLIAGTRGSAAAIGVWDSMHLLVSLAGAGLLAWAAGRFLFESRRNGELEMLLSTPLGGRDIIGGNWRALCGPLRGAWLLLGFLVLVEILTGTGASLQTFQLAMAPVVRVMDIIALCWMGMWFGLKVQKPLAIMMWTVGLVVGVPWLVSYFFVLGTSLGTRGSWGSLPSSVFLFWFGVWPILNLAKNAIFISWAARKLRSELRAVAPLDVGQWLVR